MLRQAHLYVVGIVAASVLVFFFLLPFTSIYLSVPRFSSSSSSSSPSSSSSLFSTRYMFLSMPTASFKWMPPLRCCLHICLNLVWIPRKYYLSGFCTVLVSSPLRFQGFFVGWDIILISTFMEKHQVLEQQQSSPSRQTPAPDYDQEVDGLEQIIDIRVF